MTEQTRTAKIERPLQKERLQLESPYRMSIPLLLLTFVLICFGLIMLFSASMSAGYANADNPLFYVLNQSKFTLIGIVAGFAIIFIPVKTYDRIGFVMLAYVVTLALVIYTKIKGVVIGGSRRWIRIGSQTFQPSELAKIALIFCLAGYRSFIVRMRRKGYFRCASVRRQAWLDCTLDIVLPVSLLMICMVVVFLQPHMSFFIIMLILSFICLLVSGIPLRSWIDGGLILLAMALLLGNIVLAASSYEQKESFLGNFEHVATRLNIFSTMNEDTSASGGEAASSDSENSGSATDDEVYQSRQSMIAIGSGGIMGVGFGSSRQKYQYLPEAHNDYVFAIACEELGFIGGVSIVLLFLAFLVGGLVVAWRARNVFSRIMAVGYTCLIAIQAFFNIGVAVGAIPPTGITLPFFSYGGTANLFFLIAVGLILAVSRTGVTRHKVTYLD